MKTILAIGGAVIKTAYDEIKECARRKMFDVLIHNGGSLFHDFQRATEGEKLPTDSNSYPLRLLLDHLELNKKASQLVWNYIYSGISPANSLTEICQREKIEVLMFTGLGCDFWQIFKCATYWKKLGEISYLYFEKLCEIMSEPFYYICMGSAVIHPEVFTKALSIAKPKEFRTTVVDFLPNQYRPKTRISIYGKYFVMTHKEFLVKWLRGECPWLHLR